MAQVDTLYRLQNKLTEAHSCSGPGRQIAMRELHAAVQGRPTDIIIATFNSKFVEKLNQIIQRDLEGEYGIAIMAFAAEVGARQAKRMEKNTLFSLIGTCSCFIEIEQLLENCMQSEYQKINTINSALFVAMMSKNIKLKKQLLYKVVDIIISQFLVEAKEQSPNYKLIYSLLLAIYCLLENQENHEAFEKQKELPMIIAELIDFQKLSDISLIALDILVNITEWNEYSRLKISSFNHTLQQDAIRYCSI
ncbi:MAG: hypothetical protein EZS28_012580 [Streblomastix strix]|uniref:Uncharacterized protein n=1 Tax=Streblomastix strix TaxID=222440 RepID=A0A5J4WB65_9EUKA|nr:MAG: hypothetical protein EZS28_012580 [Streblomastix strix]